MSLHFFDQERCLVRRKLHGGRPLDEIRREVCDEDGFDDEQLFLLVVAAKIMGPTLRQLRNADKNPRPSDAAGSKA